jgi:hypothetical protein
LCLHGALKSRGFNLEDTGLTTEARVSTLLLAVSVAFVWACPTGRLPRWGGARFLLGVFRQTKLSREGREVDIVGVFSQPPPFLLSGP